MFTGIIENKGKLKNLAKNQSQWRLEIQLEQAIKDLKVSESLSVNGICLTVTSIKENTVSFDLLEETYQKTNIKNLKLGDELNLERALRIGDRLGGHFVTGHVDGVGVIKSIHERGKEKVLSIEAPKGLIPYLTIKGSIAVDGVSLTLGEVKDNCFEIYLIPFTLNHTNLGVKNVGSLVNLEIDVIARYVKKIMVGDKGTTVTEDFLKEHGYL